MKSVIVLVLLTLVTACAVLQGPAHGSSAWLQACAERTVEECPCHRDGDCETLWCPDGECARREP